MLPLILAGEVPENYLDVVRRHAPEWVLLVDAADFGAAARRDGDPALRAGQGGARGPAGAVDAPSLPGAPAPVHCRGNGSRCLASGNPTEADRSGRTDQRGGAPGDSPRGGDRTRLDAVAVGHDGGVRSWTTRRPSSSFPPRSAHCGAILVPFARRGARWLATAAVGIAAGHRHRAHRLDLPSIVDGRVGRDPLASRRPPPSACGSTR